MWNKMVIITILKKAVWWLYIQSAINVVFINVTACT